MRRLNFTQSVAVMSVTGYVIGLGDRHLSNIMLDRVSGQVDCPTSTVKEALLTPLFRLPTSTSAIALRQHSNVKSTLSVFRFA